MFPDMVSAMPREITDKMREKARIEAAKANRRRRNNRLAAELRQDGWQVAAPDAPEETRATTAAKHRRRLDHLVAELRQNGFAVISPEQIAAVSEQLPNVA